MIATTNRKPSDKGDALKRVLITRPEPGATETAARLSALGFLPVIAPIFAIIGRQVQPPAHVAATVLTSRNSVAPCPPALHARPVFAVGAATAAHAVQAGFKHVLNGNSDAVALVELIAGTISPANGVLFLPTGLGQGIQLAAALRQRGFRVVRRIAYQAAYVPVLPEVAATLLHQRLLTTVLFFSGEASRNFVCLLQAANLVEAVGDVEAVSISERAAMPLRALPWRRISVAATPNQDAMLVLLT